MGFVLRRSLPSIVGLIGLAVAVGFLLVVFAGAPLWFPAVFAIGLILLAVRHQSEGHRVDGAGRRHRP